MIEDERLLKMLRCTDTESAAVEQIIAKYSRYVAAVLLNAADGALSAEDVEELSQNVFFSLWQHRNRIRSANLRGWLAAAARNGARSFLRKRRFETVDIDDCPGLSGGDLQTLADADERSRYLERSLERLDPRTRDIFVRRYFLGQSLESISEALSLNCSTVKTKLRRGRMKLREELVKGGFSYDD